MAKTDLDETALAKLAREMAMNIRNYRDIFADYGIDENDYAKIERNEYYRKVKEHFTLEWNSSGSTADRISHQSLAGYEQLMPILIRRAMREDTPLPAAIETGKLLQKTAGIGEKGLDKANLERFVITINMGDDREHYDKPIAVTEPLPAIGEDR